MVVIRRLGALIRFGLGVFLATFAVVLFQAERVMEQHYAGRGLDAPADAALVLGAGIEADGYLSFEGRRRVVTGVKLYRRGLVRRLIVSDGSLRTDDATVAGVMRRYAMRLGVPGEDIVEDGLARTTFENVRIVGAMLPEHEVTSVILVTDAYHLTRSRLLARYFGLPVTGVEASDSHLYISMPERVLGLTRETMAWWYNLGKIVAWSGLGLAGWTEDERVRHVY